MDKVFYIAAGIMLISGICGMVTSFDAEGWFYLLCGIFGAIVFIYQGIMMASVKSIRKTVADNLDDPFFTFAKKYYREILANSLHEHLKSDSLPSFTDAKSDRYPSFIKSSQEGYYDVRASFYATDSTGEKKFYVISAKLLCVDTAHFWSKDAWKCDGPLKNVK